MDLKHCFPYNLKRSREFQMAFKSTWKLEVLWPKCDSESLSSVLNFRAIIKHIS